MTNCIREWMKRCGTIFHQELLEKLIIEPLKDSANDFCDPKNPYRPSKSTSTLVFDPLKTLLTNSSFGRVLYALNHSNDKTLAKRILSHILAFY